MLNENAKKWVAALRSGEFEQTTHTLRDHKGFCCLGVACEAYRREIGGDWDEMNDVFSFLNGEELLPMEVKDWLGIRGYAGDYGPISSQKSLAGENDKGKSFLEIADLIESEPEGLFKK